MSTKIIAHRGFSGMEPENTELAFIAAGNRKEFYGIETDVHRTADGKYVVIHDDSTLRVAGVSIDVEDSTLEELQAIALLDKDGASNPCVRIPTLRDYIKTCRRYGKVSVLEIKSEMSPGDISEVVKIIRELGMLDKTVFISFHASCMTAIRELLPEQPAQFLFDNWDKTVEDFIVKYRLDVDIRDGGLDRAAFDRMKELGKTVNVWTVNDPSRAAELASWGVDMITTNIITEIN